MHRVSYTLAISAVAGQNVFFLGGGDNFAERKLGSLGKPPGKFFGIFISEITANASNFEKEELDDPGDSKYPQFENVSVYRSMGHKAKFVNVGAGVKRDVMFCAHVSGRVFRGSLEVR